MPPWRGHGFLEQSPIPRPGRNFTIDDLKSWTKEHRGELLAALLTLVRAWYKAGKPKPKTKPLGSYERWTITAGGILQNPIFNRAAACTLPTGGEARGAAIVMPSAEIWEVLNRNGEPSLTLRSLENRNSKLHALQFNFAVCPRPSAITTKYCVKVGRC